VKSRAEEDGETEREREGGSGMGFWVGMLLGVAAGVAVIVGFARFENSRAARRRQLVSPPCPHAPPRGLRNSRCVLLA
jgi:hypothetical protein